MKMPKLRIPERWWLLGLALAYALCIVHAYTFKVSPVFGYMGYDLVDHPSWLLVASIGWALVPVFFLPARSARASTIFLWVMYLIVLVPSLIVPTLGVRMGVQEIIRMQIALILGFVTLCLFTRKPPRPVAKAPLGVQGWTFLILALVVLSFCILIPILGVSPKVHSYAEIYLVRGDLKEDFENASSIGRYVLPWMAYAIVPLATLQCLIQRRWRLLAALILTQAYLFLQTGHKSYLLPFIVLPCALWAFARVKDRIPLFLLMTILGLFGVAYLLDAWTGSPLATSLIIRRSVITPGLLTGVYFDFFAHHPHILFSNNLLKPFLAYPYPAPIPFVIGNYYFNAPDMSANANIWADAYANLGVLGVLLFSALLGWILRLYEGIVLAKWSEPVGAVLFLVPMLSLTNSALFTCLLTHGIALFLLLTWLMPRSVLLRWESSREGSVP